MIVTQFKRRALHVPDLIREVICNQNNPFRLKKKERNHFQGQLHSYYKKIIRKEEN